MNKHTHAIVAIVASFIIFVIGFCIYKKNVNRISFSKKQTRIGFFCKSGDILSPQQYYQLNAVFKHLNKSEYAIVYGGGKDGIMGQVGQLAINNELLLHAIDSTQFNESQYSEAHVTLYDTLVSRENVIINNTDIAIILPGHYGTLMELFWLATLNNIHVTKKKIIIWNMDDYYTTLIEFLNSNKFQSNDSTSLLANGIVVCNTYQEVLFNIKNA